jgi:hypothetical protein
MLVRVHEFGGAHQGLFLKSSPGGKLFAKVEDAVTKLSEHAVSKMSARSAAHDGARARAGVRRVLQQQVDAISRTARLMQDATPDLADKFRMGDIHNDQALLTSARLAARDAVGYKAAFITHGLPATFLSDLDTALEQFEEALHARDAGRDDHLAARASIEAALASGMAAARKLDVWVANRLHDDAVTLSVWERDRHVVRVVRKGRKAKPNTETPAPTPAIAPALQTAATPEVSTAAPQTAVTQTTPTQGK